MAKNSGRRSAMGRRAVISWDESDITSAWKDYLCYLHKPGAKAWIKNKANRRTRRDAKAEIRSGSLVQQ